MVLWCRSRKMDLLPEHWALKDMPEPWGLVWEEFLWAEITIIFITLLSNTVLQRNQLPTIYFTALTWMEFHRTHNFSANKPALAPSTTLPCRETLLALADLSVQQGACCSPPCHIPWAAWQHHVPWALPWAALPNGFTFRSRKGSCFLQTDYEFKYFPELLFTGFLMRWASA